MSQPRRRSSAAGGPAAARLPHARRPHGGLDATFHRLQTPRRLHCQPQHAGTINCRTAGAVRTSCSNRQTSRGPVACTPASKCRAAPTAPTLAQCSKRPTISTNRMDLMVRRLPIHLRPQTAPEDQFPLEFRDAESSDTSSALLGPYLSPRHLKTASKCRLRLHADVRLCLTPCNVTFKTFRNDFRNDAMQQRAAENRGAGAGVHGGFVQSRCCKLVKM